MKKLSWINLLLVVIASIAMTACPGGSGGGGNNGGGKTTTYSVGGSVTGLSGMMVLRNNGSDDLTVTSDGGFTFATALANNTAYSVTIASRPAAQSCTMTNGSGTIAGVNVTNVAVTCIAIPQPPTPGKSGSLDTGFGSGGKVTTDFSGTI